MTTSKGREELWPRVAMKALSWRQPYASMMLHGKVETRTWETKYRGQVLICATQRSYTLEQIIAISGDYHASRINDILGSLLNLPSGVAIAVGTLIDCRRMTPRDSDECYVEYHNGLWCHIYDRIKPIEPIPFKGKQGWTNISGSHHIVQALKYL